ncbi:hypothetical protein DL96DRAFT_1610345 [Flagelloscypha sp. PMI_526]|nr:hypothetical protein DL96DRAFT_1610345 [Flagelloscypha sp. PMI_526]
MFFPHIFGLVFLPCLVWAETQYFLDDTNTTAWTVNSYDRLPDSGSYRGTSLLCRLDGCSGTLEFQGSSVEIYGVKTNGIMLSGQNCSIDFSWPSGNATYEYDAASQLSIVYDVSFLKVGGFNANETSYVRFKQNIACAALDYAIISVENTVVPTASASSMTPSSTTEHGTLSTTTTSSAASVTNSSADSVSSDITKASRRRPSTALVVGGVISAVVAFVLLGSGIWLLRRRRKGQHAYEVPTSSSAETAIVYDNLASLPPNSLAMSARYKQIFADRSYAAQLAPLTTSNLSPSSQRSETEELLSPNLNWDPELSPAVQARLSQLEAAIHEIRSQGVLPPAY